jgi:hypothetical protein
MFKHGDKVKYTGGYPLDVSSQRLIIGKVYTVSDISDSSYFITVFNSEYGLGIRGHAYWMNPKDFRLVYKITKETVNTRLP